MLCWLRVHKVLLGERWSSKAIILQNNIDLQQMQGIEKQLNLMERFKSSFVNISTKGGEEGYDQAVKDMLDDIPFMKKHNGGS